jgi:hypothetical protein
MNTQSSMFYKDGKIRIPKTLADRLFAKVIYDLNVTPQLLQNKQLYGIPNEFNSDEDNVIIITKKLKKD